MNLSIFLTAFLAVLAISASGHSETVPDRFIGKVNILNPSKLDTKAKKELVSIAARIKKSMQKGTVKLKGDVPSAESEDDYIVQSAFMARNVETYLKPLLAGRYQVFVTASKFSGEKRAGQNSVEINLYPHELMVEVDGFTGANVTSQEKPAEGETFYEKPIKPVYQQPESGLLSLPADDHESAEATSKKERSKQVTENPALANELVIRAKARAAEKARRLQQSE